MQTTSRLHSQAWIPAHRPFGPTRSFVSRQRGVTVPTVRDIVVPAPLRIAGAMVDAGLVRDVAAFAALVVLATMLSVLTTVELPF
jgi:hypothetical protein